ncbi:52 kDa repressor of the inhibitor of the protein kinase-like isoform X1, partial [Aphis craccivora]
MRWDVDALNLELNKLKNDNDVDDPDTYTNTIIEVPKNEYEDNEILESVSVTNIPEYSAVGVGEIMKSSEQEQECNDDISIYVGKTLSSDEKVLALNKLWIPMPGYNFPKTGKRNLKFQYSWLLHHDKNDGKGNH